MPLRDPHPQRTHQPGPYHLLPSHGPIANPTFPITKTSPDPERLAHHPRPTRPSSRALNCSSPRHKTSPRPEPQFRARSFFFPNMPQRLAQTSNNANPSAPAWHNRPRSKGAPRFTFIKYPHAPLQSALGFIFVRPFSRPPRHSCVSPISANRPFLIRSRRYNDAHPGF